MAKTRRRSQPVAVPVPARRPRREAPEAAASRRRGLETSGWWSPAAALEVGLLAIAVVLPLAFSRLSSEAFELPKTIALRSLLTATLVAAVVGVLSRWPADALWLDRLRDWRALRQWLTARRTWPILVAALAVSVAWLLATATSIAPAVSWWGIPLKWAGTRTQLAYVLVFVLAAAVITGRGRAVRLASALAGTAAVASLYAVLQAAGADPFAWQYAGTGELSRTDIRPASMLGNPNFFADLLCLTIFATGGALVASLRGQNGRWWPWAASLAVQVAALILTQTRGAWVATGAGAVVFALLVLLLRGGNWRRRALLVGGAVLLLGSGLWLAAPVLPQQGILGRVASLARPTEGSGGIRLLVWNATWRLWLQRPALGYGPDTFSAAIQREYDPALVFVSGPAIADRAENATLDTLQATGIVGLLALLAVFVAVGWATWRVLAPLGSDGVMPSRRERSLYRDPLTAGMVAGLVAHVIADHFTLESPAASAIAWLLAGAVCGAARALDASPPASAPVSAARAPLPTWLPSAGAAVGALLAVLYFWGELAPLRASVAFDRAMWEQNAGRTQEALASLTEAVSLWPHNPTYWLALGGAKREAARTRPQPGTLVRDALGDVEQAMALSPQHPAVISAWGAAAAELAAQTRDTALEARARAANQRAIDLTPRFWRYWAASADVEMALGNVSLAKERYARAAALNDVDWVVWSNFGDAAVQTSDYSAARTAWQRAVEMCEKPQPGRRACSAAEAATLKNKAASLPR